MDSLSELLDAKLQFVVDHEKHPPTPPQLAQFLRSACDAARPMVAQCPPDVKRGVTRGFASIGWDFSRNAGVTATPPTFGAVRQMFEGIAKFVASYAEWKNQNIKPSAAELADISAAAQRLWELDGMNRLVPGVDYEIDLQVRRKRRTGRREQDGIDRVARRASRRDEIHAKPVRSFTSPSRLPAAQLPFARLRPTD